MELQVKKKSTSAYLPGNSLPFPTDTLIGALAKRKDVNMLTAVSNNAGSGENGLGK